MLVIQEDILTRLGTGGASAGQAGLVVDELRQRGRAILTAAQQDGKRGGLPHKHLEEWRQTDISGLLAHTFVPGPTEDTPAATTLRDQFTLGAQASAEIVLVNGVFVPGLSRVGATVGVRVWAVSQGVDAAAQADIAGHLGRYATINSNPEQGFVALNGAGVRDVVVIILPPRVVLEKPVHVLMLTTDDSIAEGTKIASYPRVLVLAQTGAQGALLETFAGPNEAVYLTNAVTEIVLGENSRLEYCRIQQEGLKAYHLATIEAHLSQGATLVSDAATLGAALSRVDLNVRLAGAHAEATLNGLVLIGGNQHADNHTLLDHAVEQCASHELYKHVLNDRASGVCKGKILVRPDAQKTDAKQTSRNLLLSDDATI
ncbi:MAG: SufD family Fe-S cluster assembly protein, partial [Phycisphaerae bacterium]